ncbi:hypothetical protein BH11PLA2_BH11PLA2_06440 [soil metagenome]
MRLTPWLTLRQAKEALRTGRPEDAHRLLEPLLAEDYRRAWRLSRDVAVAYIAQGERFLRQDDTERAWQQVLLAESLNTGEPRAAALRQSLIRLAHAECRAALEAGNPLHAVETITKLKSHNARHPDFDSLLNAAQDWVLATDMADRGDFLLAATTVENVRPRLVNVPHRGLDNFLTTLHERHDTYRNAVSHLTDAADQRQWKDAAMWAAKVIAVAPAHREARNIQLRAWEQVQGVTHDYRPAPDADIVTLTSAFTASSKKDVEPPRSSVSGLPKRFLLWIDGVGGYLVCMGNRITFGQATGEAPIDVPLLADVSRLHAEIARDGEGCVLESSRGALVNGSPVTRALLKPGDRVTLGATCQFLFHQAVAISPTARLELVSGHRLQIAVDGVLLMADNLILGPPGQSHISVPWLTQPVVLYRSKDGLGVRIPGEFRVDAKAELNRANLALPSVVTSDQLSFAVEAVTTVR